MPEPQKYDWPEKPRNDWIYTEYMTQLHEGISCELCSDLVLTTFLESWSGGELDIASCRYGQLEIAILYGDLEQIANWVDEESGSLWPMCGLVWPIYMSQLTHFGNKSSLNEVAGSHWPTWTAGESGMVASITSFMLRQDHHCIFMSVGVN
jgi:hypothetical protein